MTRTDVMASSRPRTAEKASKNAGSARAWRVLTAVSLVLALMLALVAPGAAVAAEPTSKYNQEPGKPSTGTAPAKETTTPTTTTPTTTTPTPTSTTAPATSEKARTLPFTGFDLRWDVGIGLLLIFAGVSIVLVQRRQRRASDR
jgi:cell division protein FtsN